MGLIVVDDVIHHFHVVIVHASQILSSQDVSHNTMSMDTSLAELAILDRRNQKRLHIAPHDHPLDEWILTVSHLVEHICRPLPTSLSDMLDLLVRLLMTSVAKSSLAVRRERVSNVSPLIMAVPLVGSRRFGMPGVKMATLPYPPTIVNVVVRRSILKRSGRPWMKSEIIIREQVMCIAVS